jgi:hypothetical protein
MVLSVTSELVLNETFADLSKWVNHQDGRTSVIELVNATADSMIHSGISATTLSSNPSYLFTNITHCPETGCYRSEVAVMPSLRPLIFKNVSVEYWLGTSIYVPTSWSYKQPKAKWEKDAALNDLTYHFQIHGGINEGSAPNLGITFRRDKVFFQICGSPHDMMNDLITPTCKLLNVGKIAVGQWMDFVVNSQLSYEKSPHHKNIPTSGQPLGWVKIWRNNQLMYDIPNILTSYNQTMPPYVIAGSYQYNWKINQPSGGEYQWSAVYHNAVKVGTQHSSYEEVYTGNGMPCGDYCILHTVTTTPIFTSFWFWFIVPAALIMFCTCVLCNGNREFRNKRASVDPAQKAATGNANEWMNGGGVGGHDEEEGSDETSDEGSLEDEEVRHSFRPVSFRQKLAASFRSTSKTRTVFWYFFAVCFVCFVFLVSAILYGIPEWLELPYGSVIVYKHLSDWKADAQWTMFVISVTMMMIYFLPLLYIQHDFEAGRRWKNDPNFLYRIGVIIPCHKSASEIGEGLRRVLKYIPPQNIVVCDNGNFDGPPDHTFEVVKKANPLIQYIYIKQGHKTRALWTGAHRLPKHVEYIIHLDDDTHFDEYSMVFDESHFLKEDHVIAVGYLRSSYGINRVTQFTDFWYKITDHFHATQAKIATRCFVPGPMGLWKRNKFLEIFGQHPSLPFGEDIFGGFTTLNNGYAIRVESRCQVKTFAPDVLVPLHEWFGWIEKLGLSLGVAGGRVQGYGASSLWKQRAHRWTVSALRITGKSLWSFFTYDTKLGIWSNIAFRLYRFREYKLIIVQLFYLPVCIVLIIAGYYYELFLLKLMLFGCTLIRNLYINYICWYNTPELQVTLRTVLTSPFYNFFLICCAIHGRWKCILWYLPEVSPNHHMLQRTKPRAKDTIPIELNDFTPIAIEDIQIASSSASCSQDQEEDQFTALPSIENKRMKVAKSTTFPELYSGGYNHLSQNSPKNSPEKASIATLSRTTSADNFTIGEDESMEDEEEEMNRRSPNVGRSLPSPPTESAIPQKDLLFEMFEKGNGESKIIVYKPKDGKFKVLGKKDKKGSETTTEYFKPQWMTAYDETPESRKLKQQQEWNNRYQVTNQNRYSNATLYQQTATGQSFYNTNSGGVSTYSRDSYDSRQSRVSVDNNSYNLAGLYENKARDSVKSFRFSSKMSTKLHFPEVAFELGDDGALDIVHYEPSIMDGGHSSHSRGSRDSYDPADDTTRDGYGHFGGLQDLDYGDSFYDVESQFSSSRYNTPSMGQGKLSMNDCYNGASTRKSTILKNNKASSFANGKAGGFAMKTKQYYNDPAILLGEARI